MDWSGICIFIIGWRSVRLGSLGLRLQSVNIAIVDGCCVTRRHLVGDDPDDGAASEQPGPVLLRLGPLGACELGDVGLELYVNLWHDWIDLWGCGGGFERALVRVKVLLEWP